MIKNTIKTKESFLEELQNRFPDKDFLLKTTTFSCWKFPFLILIT